MLLRQVPGKICLFAGGIVRHTLRILMRPLFEECSSSVNFNPFDQFTYHKIKIGNDVFIGKGACFSSQNGITIGNKVLIGPNVTIMGGDHNTSVLGKYMADVKTKLAKNDIAVKVEDDVWVGTGAIILKGVNVGRGAIIAAGSVVNCNVEPYSVVGGVPAKHIRFRWTKAEISRHEKELYPESCS